MSDGGDWFVYDKSTAVVDGYTLSFTIVERGLSKSDAMSHTLKDGFVAARHPEADVEPTPDEDLSHRALAKRHNGGRTHCVNCGGMLSRDIVGSDDIEVVHEGC